MSMDSHLLFELAHMFYRVCSATIYGERRLVESSRKLRLFYPPCEGWFRNLIQRLFHNICSHSSAIRASMFSPMMRLFIIGEGFTWWSSWPLFVNGIFFIVGRGIEAGGDRLYYARWICFFKSSIFRCMALLSSRLWETWLLLRKPPPLAWTVCTLPSR